MTNVRVVVEQALRVARAQGAYRVGAPGGTLAALEARVLTKLSASAATATPPEVSPHVFRRAVCTAEGMYAAAFAEGLQPGPQTDVIVGLGMSGAGKDVIRQALTGQPSRYPVLAAAARKAVQENNLQALFTELEKSPAVRTPAARKVLSEGSFLTIAATDEEFVRRCLKEAVDAARAVSDADTTTAVQSL